MQLARDAGRARLGVCAQPLSGAAQLHVGSVPARESPGCAPCPRRLAVGFLILLPRNSQVLSAKKDLMLETV